LTTPSAVTITFAGLMSRWMIPFSWAFASPRQICSPISAASTAATGPRAIRARNVSPS
jgi:hypothetical protein